MHQRRALYADKDGEGMMTLFGQDDNRAPTKKDNDWFTPAVYVDAAREVMGGGIDLDPASCEQANRVVRATRYYTKEDNGLMHSWYGRIWLNPPYGRIHPELKGSTRSWQVYFMQILLERYLTCKVEQGIALLFGTSACMAWFQPFWQFPICLAKSRINFMKPNG